MVAIPHIPPFPLQDQLWLDHQTDKMLLIHINTRVYNVLWKDNTGEIPVIIYGDHRLICRLKIKKSRQKWFLKEGRRIFCTGKPAQHGMMHSVCDPPSPPPCKLASSKPRTLPDSCPPDPSLYGMTQIYTSGWNFAENYFNTGRDQPWRHGCW